MQFQSLFRLRHLSAIALTCFLSVPSSSFAAEKIKHSDQAYFSRIAALKAEQDRRSFRTFTLSNRLEVLLIQDPAAKKSAAAVDVGVGFLMDPPEYRGLAHYLEHMLFLGTEKYPKVEEYDEFLSKNGGYSNAYTWFEHTNYYFEVNPSAFPEALDRFGQFFIHPRFNEDYVDRELENINSEYTKDLTDSGFRKVQLMAALADPSHPESRFFQGSRETLKNFPRKALRDFYDQYYSASRMKLAIITSLPLDEVEKNVRGIFPEVPSRYAAMPKLSGQVVKPENLPRLVQIKPLGEEYELELMFSLPPYQNYLLSTPQSLITSLVNYEGEGSLSRVLKSQGLITEMGASPSSDSYRSAFSVKFKLSKDQSQNWKRVVSTFFSYIQMLNKEDLNHQFFSDTQKIAELKHIFGTPKTGGNGASSLARDMHKTSPLLIEAINDLEVRYSQKAFHQILRRITPEAMQIALTAPDVHTNQKEPFFQIDYSVSPFAPETIEEWKKVSADPQFSYPPANPYLPTDLSSDGENMEVPLEIRNTALSQIWLQSDHTFHKPKAAVQFEIVVPRQGSLAEKTLKQLYIKAIDKSLTEWGALAQEAGLSCSLTEGETGYTLTFSGYADKLGVFAKDVISRLTTLTINETQFSNLKDEFILSIQNKPKTEDPYQIASSELNVLMKPHSQSEEELLPWIAKATLDDVRGFAKKAFQKVYLRGFGFGHIGKETMEGITDRFLSTYQPNAIESSEFPKKQRVQLAKGRALIRSLQAENEESAWLLIHQFGRTKPERAASLQLGSIFFASPFYTEMRTVNSFGYIVSSSASISPISSAASFVIQSNQDLAKVASVAEDWIQKRVQKLADLSDSDFETLRKGALEDFDKPAMTFSDKFSLFSDAIFSYNGDWNWKNKRIGALKTISKTEVVRRWIKAFDPKTQKKLTVIVLGNKSKSSWVDRAQEDKIQDAQSFKNSMNLY